MARLTVRNSARALSGILVAAVVVFVPSGTGFVSPSAIAPRPADSTAPLAIEIISPRSRPSEFEKEEAMSVAERIARWAPHIKEASRRFNVSESWIRAVIRMESGGRTWFGDRLIRSHAGAMGIMQLMPATYREMRELHGLGEDPHDPRDNVLAGTAYLRWLYEKYGFPKMFAAYNAGPGTIEKRRRLPRETQHYVRGISRILNVKTVATGSDLAQPEKVIAMLTRPDGSSITIDAATVKSIRPSLPNEFVPGVQTVVAMGEKEQGVREDLATVAAALKRPSA
jgi:hypothetical protein